MRPPTNSSDTNDASALPLLHDNEETHPHAPNMLTASTSNSTADIAVEGSIFNWVNNDSSRTPGSSSLVDSELANLHSHRESRRENAKGSDQSIPAVHASRIIDNKPYIINL